MRRQGDFGTVYGTRVPSSARWRGEACEGGVSCLDAILDRLRAPQRTVPARDVDRALRPVFSFHLRLGPADARPVRVRDA